MKKKRHSMILKLIAQFDIATQEELLEKLRENGFDATQATVSRDIKEMRIVKAQDIKGIYRYIYPKNGKISLEKDL